MSSAQDHWEHVWSASDPDTLSWHQTSSTKSFELIKASVDERSAPIIDVGGGDSPLAGQLVQHGFTDVTVLDIAPAALVRARHRLAGPAELVSWITTDVRHFAPDRTYHLWHDRAMFHFLTDPADRRQYADAAAASVAPGGWLIVAAFAINGPAQCSGLTVQRHSEASLTDALGARFTPVEFVREDHTTPRGARQHFIYGRFRHDEDPTRARAPAQHRRATMSPPRPAGVVR